MRKAMMILLVVCIIVIGLPTLLYLAWDYSSRRELEQAYAELKAAGRPLTLEEILPPQVPDEENGMIDVLRLCKYFQDYESYEHYEEIIRTFTIAHYKENPEPYNKMVQDTYLRNFIKNLHNAFQKPYMRIRRNNSTCNNFRSLEYTIGLKTLFRFLPAIASIQMLDYQPEDAWDTLLLYSRLLAIFHNELTGCERYFRFQIVKKLVDRVQELASIFPPNQITSKTLIDKFQYEEDISSYLCYYNGELLIDCTYIDELLLNHYKSFYSIHSLAEYPNNIESLRNRVRWYKSKLLPNQRVEKKLLIQTNHNAYCQLTAPLSSKDDRYDDLITSSLPKYSLVLELQPGFGATKKYTYATISRARVTRCGLEILQYRQKKGSYPQTLAELGMGEWIDPMSQKELIYKPRANGFLLYSVGQNLVDDGGKVVEHKSDQGDIVWDYTAPDAVATPAE